MPIFTRSNQFNVRRLSRIWMCLVYRALSGALIVEPCYFPRQYTQSCFHFICDITIKKDVIAGRTILYFITATASIVESQSTRAYILSNFFSFFFF